MRVNKKILYILIPILLVISLSVIRMIILNNSNNGLLNNSIKEETYIAYVSINPLVKLDFKIECKNESCDEPVITSYELVNEDAKEIYKDISFNGEKLNDVLEILTSTAEDNDIDSEYIDIYTDWEDSTNYMPTNSDKHHYIVKHLETEELTSNEFEEELVSDPYIVAKVEIPAPFSSLTCNHKTDLVTKPEYGKSPSSEGGDFICGPFEYCGYMDYESHPDMWEGPAYACRLMDAVGNCIGKITYGQPIITVTIRTKQSTYDSFKSNKCYELTYDKYCACKDSYVQAKIDRTNIDEVGKHKVNATIKSSSSIEILPFENGIPYVEFELGLIENYEQVQSMCESSNIGTTVPAPTCSD